MDLTIKVHNAHFNQLPQVHSLSQNPDAHIPNSHARAHIHIHTRTHTHAHARTHTRTHAHTNAYATMHRTNSIFLMFCIYPAVSIVSMLALNCDLQVDILKHPRHLLCTYNTHTTMKLTVANFELLQCGVYPSYTFSKASCLLSVIAWTNERSSAAFSKSNTARTEKKKSELLTECDRLNEWR